MKLRQSDIDKLERFLGKIKKEVYPEPSSWGHTDITKKVFRAFTETYGLAADSKIMDVGCGQGVALKMFSKEGFCPVGITLDPVDVAECRKKGFEVYEMDQSFLKFDNQEFDLIWCRHCLEHSIFPYFTLSEFFRVLKPQGYLYVEVPAPNTSCRHEMNQNHYSVLGKTMWIELMKRTGFHLLDVIDINLTVPKGPDLYWAFVQQRL